MNKVKTSLTFKWFMVACLSSILFIGCKKDFQPEEERKQQALSKSAKMEHGHLKQTKTYSSDVVVKWMDMQLQLMKTATGIPNVAFARHYAYSGIALYEAVVPGMPAYQSLSGQLQGLSGLPQTGPGFAYYWPDSLM